MTGFWVLDISCLVAVLGCAVLVVNVRNLAGAAMSLSAMGMVLTLVFVVLGAPDDAHSEAVVGAIALPAVYLIAIGKVRADVRDQGEIGERSDSAAKR